MTYDSASILRTRNFILKVHIYIEDGGSRFIRNVTNHTFINQILTLILRVEAKVSSTNVGNLKLLHGIILQMSSSSLMMVVAYSSEKLLTTHKNQRITPSRSFVTEHLEELRHAIN
jgi:hypothetical protein